MVSDHKVRRRRYEDEIKASADAWRNKICGNIAKDNFNITQCIKVLTQNSWIRSYDTRQYHELRVRFYNQGRCQPFAYVEHNPTILYCDHEVWSEACIGEPKARFILAHELGHVLLHDHYAQPFTENLKRSAWMKEESGEWQANTFADYFLVSDVAIERYLTPTAIAIYCGVEKIVALRRLGPGFGYVGESCERCGNFTLVRNGRSLICDTCGQTTSC
ncbi:ImmA/IrrE family metallo-endopeptidase [Roseiarcus fermentans]|uniref:ImmA/IrrE family metallo-endopeptidase n=1 Tax=Roseiarcus fermentans TaxID=1473586 RepID=UPI000DEB93F2